MTKRHKVSDFFANYILASLMSTSLIYALTSSLNFHYQWNYILVMSLTFMLIHAGAFFNKLLSILSGSLLMLVICVNGFQALSAPAKSLPVSTIQWLAQYIGEQTPLDARYEIIITLSISFAISLLVYFFTFKRIGFIFFFIGTLSIFISQWMLDFFVSYTAFYVYVFLILVYYLRSIYLKKIHQEHHEYVPVLAYLLWVLPICLITVFVANQIPTSKEPIIWDWMDKKVLAIYKNLTHSVPGMIELDYFSTSQIGFTQEKGLLGGKIESDTTEVLKVYTGRNIYLRGASYTSYTGNRWNRNPSRSIYNSIDSMFSQEYKEILYGIKLLSMDNYATDKYFFGDEVQIQYLNMSTKSLFIPYISTKLTGNDVEGFSIFSDSASVLTSSRWLKKGTKYTTTTYIPKTGNEELQNLLRTCRKGFYETVLEQCVPKSESITVNNTKVPVITLLKDKSKPSNDKENTVLIAGLDYGDLRKMADTAKSIYQPNSSYLQLPAAFPERIAALAQDVTRDKENDYDKAKALEQYLSSQFTYTLSPPATPKNRDFVDYFLFDSRQGHCQYFASSMAMMARSIGIPSRYVEGFVLPSSQTDGYYIITNERAHAWVEVYLEGFGWVPFEPTAAYTASFYNGTRDLQLSTSPNTPTQPVDPYTKMGDRYKKELDPYENEDMGESTSGASTRGNSLWIWILQGFGLLVLSVLLGMCILKIVHYHRKIGRFGRLPARDGILGLYKYFLTLLDIQGYGLELGETPSQYARRIDTYIIFNNHRFDEITRIFLKARYSTAEMQDKDRDLLLHFKQDITLNTKANIGTFQYFLRMLMLCLKTR